MGLEELSKKDLTNLIDFTQKRVFALEGLRRELLDITALKPREEFDENSPAQLDLFKLYENKLLQTSRDLAVEKLGKVVEDLKKENAILDKVREALNQKLAEDRTL